MTVHTYLNTLRAAHINGVFPSLSTSSMTGGIYIENNGVIILGVKQYW